MRKGQAAMEFLMTYGWAILVVLAAIGALAYFGVLSPDRFLPDKCVASPPFTCAEYKAAYNAGTLRATLRFQNNAGYDIRIWSLNLTNSTAAGCTGGNATDVPNSGLIGNGESVTLTLNATAGGSCIARSGAKFKSDFALIYQQTDGSVNKTATGNVQMRIE